MGAAESRGGRQADSALLSRSLLRIKSEFGHARLIPGIFHLILIRAEQESPGCSVKITHWRNLISLRACFCKMSSLPKFNLSPMVGRRNRTVSENSESGVDAAQDAGVSYDMDGKFTFSKVMNCNMKDSLKTTVDENGKFSYMSADMRPVPPGWYNIDKTKHRVPVGWYQMGQQNQKGK